VPQLGRGLLTTAAISATISRFSVRVAAADDAELGPVRRSSVREMSTCGTVELEHAPQRRQTRCIASVMAMSCRQHRLSIRDIVDTGAASGIRLIHGLVADYGVGIFAMPA